jgi:ubiquinone/menaquinone biosynthesis C-methylase UbiE
MFAKAPRLGMSGIAVMDGERLSFRHDSFDTVVSTLATCTFPDPVQALWEMRRVCRRGERILLLEHGAAAIQESASGKTGLAPKWAAHLGCWWNRDLLATIRRAGLQPRIAERRFLGMLYIVHI